MDEDVPTSIELNVVKKGVKRNEPAIIRRKVRGKRALNIPSPGLKPKPQAVVKKNQSYLDEFASGIDYEDVSKKANKEIVKKFKKSDSKPPVINKSSVDEFAELDEEFRQLAQKRFAKSKLNHHKSSGKPFRLFPPR